MTKHSLRPYSYRDDAAVPSFDDSRPIFVFDGTCPLCSGGVRFLMTFDRAGKVAFTSAQETIGAALYQHYALPVDDTYLLIDRGEALGMSEGYFRLFSILGGLWPVLRLFAILPELWLDRAYRAMARNRFRLGGKVEQCRLLTPEQRRRLL